MKLPFSAFQMSPAGAGYFFSYLITHQDAALGVSAGNSTKGAG